MLFSDKPVYSWITVCVLGICMWWVMVHVYKHRLWTYVRWQNTYTCTINLSYKK